MEPLLVDSRSAEHLLPAVGQALAEKGVEMRSCPQAKVILGDLAVEATNEDWDTEYLDLICSVRVVDGVDGALEHINRHGSGHTECIVTEDEVTARRFQLEADTSTVFWNASTRFSDGGEFGMGAEIGISTDRFHARGPCGLREIMSYKYVVHGSGQIR